MRNILLSMRSEVFEKIILGEKIYEYRRVFPCEPVKAYIYVSRPIQAICGIIYFGNRNSLEDWSINHSNNQEVVKIINEYRKSYKFVMKVQKI